MPKFIFITGGVVSSLGKGVTSASIGMLLERRGLKISMQKLDPYLNVDPGTMSPFQHGEVYVTDDGAETDLDIGHYERFTDAVLTKDSNCTTGKIYSEVIAKERRGDYLGKTVQVIPHITDEIKAAIHKSVAHNSDVALIEIGGTVGDIESLPFLEAIRQMGLDLGKDNVLYVHLSLIPYLKPSAEMKTKPTQHSVSKLREIGIQPDIIICRTQQSLTEEIKAKISLFCSIYPDSVIEEKDVDYSIYEVPLVFARQRLDDLIIKQLHIKYRGSSLKDWEAMLERIRTPKHTVEIVMVGKYLEMRDAYKSIFEALNHGGIANNARVRIRKVNAEAIESGDAERYLKDAHGILVPGGFGERGIEGKIKAIEYARVKQIPFFGLCLGMQCAMIEFARNVCGLKGAHSKEFDQATPHPVIDLMEHQRGITNRGGTMRLGAYPCQLLKDSHAFDAYRDKDISERHRHRYEFNNNYREEFQKKGMGFSGLSPDEKLVEIIELKDHPWFVGVQFHPEFKSKPIKAHPLFRGFVKASLEKNNIRKV